MKNSTVPATQPTKPAKPQPPAKMTNAEVVSAMDAKYAEFVDKYAAKNVEVH